MDFKHYAEMFLEEIHNQVIEDNFPGACKDISCTKLLETRDPYGTGDSPTEYECDGRDIECPLVRGVVSSMEAKL